MWFFMPYAYTKHDYIGNDNTPRSQQNSQSFSLVIHLQRFTYNRLHATVQRQLINNVHVALTSPRASTFKVRLAIPWLFSLSVHFHSAALKLSWQLKGFIFAITPNRFFKNYFQTNIKNGKNDFPAKYDLNGSLKRLSSETTNAGRMWHSDFPERVQLSA